jgi:dihydroneopterin aldolase
VSGAGPAPTVIRIGGSFAGSTHLPAWLDAIAVQAGRVVVVPGGGPFADAVRKAQPDMGFDDRAAHRMALLAMEQYGAALASLRTGWIVASSAAGIRRALADGKVPVWAPSRMVLCAKDVSWSWDVTSDSLAAWLAGRLGARRLLLVKHVEPEADELRASDLAARGVTDPAFPGFLRGSGVETFLVGPSGHTTMSGARIVLEDIDGATNDSSCPALCRASTS